MMYKKLLLTLSIFLCLICVASTVSAAEDVNKGESYYNINFKNLDSIPDGSMVAKDVHIICRYYDLDPTDANENTGHLF